ncbi:MAG: metallophosphoesterase, partial [Clostridia bacterium]|nr:metallophosphoesterase [Clostridia bacterium]
MKTMKKLMSLLLCVMMMVSVLPAGVLPAFAAEEEAVLYTATDPYWIAPADKAPLEDYAYSIAVVGDTQIVSHYQPKHLKTIVDWVLDNKDEKNIQFVSFLGDISDSWDEEDDNENGIWDSYEELEASRTEFYRLNGVIPYSIARGNHDSTAEFNKYFANDEYMSQFEGFYDIGCAKNSYRRITVGDEKFLFITLDCGVHDGALDWAGSLCEQYSDHKVIVSTHSYLHSTGVPSDKNHHSAVTTKTDGTANNGDGIWEKFVRKYENIFIVLSGHFSSSDVVCTQAVGDNGNIINQFLIDPQGLDASFNGTGSDVTGMVTMLYFSEDGKTMQVEQYSTVYDKFYRSSSQFKVDLENAYVAKDEFFYNYDFDGVPVGTQQEYIYSNAVSRLSNPYGFELDTDAKLNGTVVKHSDGSGNYLRINYSGTNTDQLTGARFRLVDKNGHSYTVAQSVSFEFDLRWQGVSDVSLIGDEQSMALLQFRRAGQTLNLLRATVVADGDVADQKLRIYTPEGNDVVTLDKDDDSFTKFKVVYYDATQSYSVWVGNQIVVEARAATGTNIRRYEYVTTLYDADFMAVSREEVSTSDGINFVFGAVAYSETQHTPFVIDVDNLSVKKYENGDGRAVYYENSFDGTNSPFANGDKTKGSSYNTIGATYSLKGSEDKYIELNASKTTTGYFSLVDQLNLFQDGDWTIEFDIRATYSNGDSDTKDNPSSAESLIRFGDSGYNNHYPLHVNEAASIRYGFVNGQVRAVPNVTMAAADSEEWTHIAVSVSVNEANKNKTDDWLATTGSSSLTYSMSVWVDGVYAGSV